MGAIEESLDRMNGLIGKMGGMIGQLMEKVGSLELEKEAMDQRISVLEDLLRQSALRKDSISATATANGGVAYEVHYNASGSKEDNDAIFKEANNRIEEQRKLLQPGPAKEPKESKAKAKKEESQAPAAPPQAEVPPGHLVENALKSEATANSFPCITCDEYEACTTDESGEKRKKCERMIKWKEQGGC